MASSPCLYLLLIVLSLWAIPCLSYTSFIFGDSLADVGNNDYLLTLSRADSPPYGIDFTPSGGRPTGRFTNGRTISDIIGEALGDSSFPPPYLAPNAAENSKHRGINFASGASGILDETGSLFLERIPLGQQINYFEEARNHMVEKMGENHTSEFLRKAVFSIASGSNDILNYLEPSIPFLGRDKMHASVLQDTMVSNLTTYLKRLHELGARKFVVVDVGPLGCIPYVRALKLVSKGRCSPTANKLVQGYNTKLRRGIYELNREMGPETMFIYANSYDIVIDLMRNSRQYGFVNANDPCCGGSFPPFLCFRGVDATESSFLCENRTEYVFWDAYHPTEATNLLIASRFLDGDASAAFPVNVRKLYEA
ncbi:GDSL esterase/lipase At5g41890 [Ananas comosus]|uniref:GDSL esterase/lipase At5g41890 n=1 Tax=Ananas comosus TaxID=4615 RepID=A0A6P5EMU4_ANACO|nr:GDSL esterase/lipase At5g41890 [Ananas comosus]